MEKHPQASAVTPLINPIHDWNDETCAMILPALIDEWMDGFTPIGSDIAIKPIKYSKKVVVASRRSDFLNNDEDSNEAARPPNPIRPRRWTMP